MKRYRAELLLALLLGLACAAAWAWFAPGERARLTPAEVDGYIARLQGKLPAPPEEQRIALERLRAWGLADDGQPVYMLNLMRYYPTLRAVPGGEAIALSPLASNAHYEQSVMPLLLQRGGWPLVGGERGGITLADGTHADLLGPDAAADGLDRVLVVRYPSRRAFLDLVSDPRYLALAPYKFAALHLALVPVTGATALPDPRWLVMAAAVIAFLAFGWWRSARRQRFP